MMVDTCSPNYLEKLRQEGDLSPGVWGKSIQHSETLSLKKKLLTGCGAHL